MSLNPHVKSVRIGALLIASIPVGSGNLPNTYQITGVVLNLETNEPIPLVEVPSSGSTYGSITNNEGRFELKTSYLPCELVVSHISYAPYNRMVDAESLIYLTIRLIPYQHEIKEISAEAMSMRK
jgi:hypothetical protein